MKTKTLALIALVLASPAFCHAADWPGYRGPSHDGISTEAAVLPASGPKEAWKTAVGSGFSSLSVSRGQAFTLAQRQVEGTDREVCVALDAATGKELWATPLGIAKYQGGGNAGTPDNNGGDGPRSTPVVDRDLVYVLSAQQGLYALSRGDGKTAWSKDLVKEHGGRLISWGNAASPVIDGNLLYVCAGGAGQSLLAFNKATGAVTWKGEDDATTHATPVPATLGGRRQIVFLTQAGLVSADARTGEILWRHKFPYSTSSAASPVVGGDIVYCSAGYGVGSGAVRVKEAGGKFEVTELWRKPGNGLCNHWSTPVYRDGHVYGIFGFKEYGRTPLKCVELATGQEKWSQEGFGPGNLIVAGRELVVLGDRGQLVFVKASPEGYHELGRVQAVTGKCWSTPALSDGRIYARSTREAVCLDLVSRRAAR